MDLIICGPVESHLASVTRGDGRISPLLLQVLELMCGEIGDRQVAAGVINKREPAPIRAYAGFEGLVREAIRAEEVFI